MSLGMMATKPSLPLLAALGVAISAHAWVLAAWGHVAIANQVKPSASAPPAAQAMQWRWRQASASATPPAIQGTAGHPALATAQATQATEAAPKATAGTGDQPVHFWPSSALDFRALPLDAPDTTPLEDLAWASDRPVRLRLWITALGKVVEVTPMDALPPPADVLAALEAVFRSTPFMPARRQGQDVASLQDIDIAPHRLSAP